MGSSQLSEHFPQNSLHYDHQELLLRGTYLLSPHFQPGVRPNVTCTESFIP